MPVYQWEQRRKDSVPAPAQEQKALKQRIAGQLAQSAGTEQFAHRDPLYHVSESFMKSFDLMGRLRGGAGQGLLGRGMQADTTEKQDPSPWQGDSPKPLEQETSMADLFEPSPGGQGNFAEKFAQTTFQRGNMAAAVLRGQGKLMLLSCLKRTIGQSQPKNFRQRKLFESAVPGQRAVEGAPADKALFNKGQTDGAVGLVVDVLRDARRAVDSMTALCQGENVLQAGSGAETLQKMYPFLSDSKEQAMKRQYHQLLKHPPGGSEDRQRTRILTEAISRTDRLIAKKSQMKTLFINHLRKLSDSAEEAVAVFQHLGFREALYSQLETELGEPPPQEPNPDDKPDPTQEAGEGAAE